MVESLFSEDRDEVDLAAFRLQEIAKKPEAPRSEEASRELGERLKQRGDSLAYSVGARIERFLMPAPPSSTDAEPRDAADQIAELEQQLEEQAEEFAAREVDGRKNARASRTRPPTWSGSSGSWRKDAPRVRRNGRRSVRASRLRSPRPGARALKRRHHPCRTSLSLGDGFLPLPFLACWWAPWLLVCRGIVMVTQRNGMIDDLEMELEARAVELRHAVVVIDELKGKLSPSHSELCVSC